MGPPRLRRWLGPAARLLAASAWLAAACPATAAGAAGSILLLHRGGGSAPSASENERALLEALRIYTRDLGLQVVEWPGAPQVASSAGELLRVTSLGQDVGAELVVWLSPPGDPPTLYALRVRDGRVHRTAVAADDAEVVARTLGLKVRSLYTRPANERPPDWIDVPITPAPPPAPATPALPSAPVAPAEPARVARPVGIELSVLGSVELPPDTTWARYGLLLRAGLLLTPASVGSIRAAVEVDGAITQTFSEATVRSSGPGGAVTSRVAVHDVPLGVSLWGRFERGPVLLAFGLRPSLHIVHATATVTDVPTVPSPGVDRLTFGIGVQATVRYQVNRAWAIAALLGAELLLPDQVFTVGGAAAPGLGGGQFLVSLGPVFRAY
jgi:hypothetical protein